MNPMLQEKLLDLLVNIVAIIIGGGLITALIEWRRHKRELATWQKEDETIQIDIPVARIAPSTWQINNKTSVADKLMIYENQLEKTVRTFVIYAEFVIRNTTPAEIVVTSYGVEVPNIPFAVDDVKFYDLESFDPTDEGNAIRLRPYASIPRVVVYFARFDKERKLERAELPTSLTVVVKTSNGKVIQNTSDLRGVGMPLGLEWHQGAFYPTKYYARIVKDEDDVPF